MPLSLDTSLIRVSGPDARPFLHNLLTQNIETLGASDVRYSGLLSPQGKVLADMLVWGDGESVIVEAASCRGEDLLRCLRMYKLRAQVSVDPVEDRFSLFSPDNFDGAKVDPRLPDGSLGYRALGATRAVEDGGQTYFDLRMRAGVPALAVDSEPDEVFALEALFDELNGVDFQKGCFIGQENVSRMKRRATTRKKFCRIASDGPPLPQGASVRAGEADLGTVRASTDGAALALLRLDRALAAVAKGVALEVDGRSVRLDPPAWLLLPDIE